MKKIINGRKYDTDTAKPVAGYTCGCASDFGYVDETLYQKRTGEFFLHGHGGPMTQYGVRYEDNSIGFGESIFPLTIGEAKIWVEERCDGDEYEKIFGEVEE